MDTVVLISRLDGDTEGGANFAVMELQEAHVRYLLGLRAVYQAAEAAAAAAADVRASQLHMIELFDNTVDLWLARLPPAIADHFYVVEEHLGTKSPEWVLYRGGLFAAKEEDTDCCTVLVEAGGLTWQAMYKHGGSETVRTKQLGWTVLEHLLHGKRTGLGQIAAPITYPDGVEGEDGDEGNDDEG